MTLQPRPTAEIIEDFERLLLRWNRQINLVSRRQTTEAVKALIEQSRVGCARIQEYLRKNSEEGDPRPGGLDYFDLGSGGGIPGFIWHLLLKEGGWDPVSYLVEPRQKRAWFLGRLAQLKGVKGLKILEGRWPEVADDQRTSGKTTLVSLKALRLPDPLILRGLSPGPGGPPCLVTICRVFPSGKFWNADLLAELRAAPAGETIEAGGVWVGRGTAELALPGKPGPGLGSLLVSSYRMIF